MQEVLKLIIIKKRVDGQIGGFTKWLPRGSHRNLFNTTAFF